MIVQENLSPIRNEPSDLSPPTSKLAISPPPGKLSFELKANVAFGQLGLAGLFILPKAESVHLDISFCGPGRISCTGRRCVGGRGVCAAYCKRAVGMLQVIAQPLANLARELSSALAADWIRLDIFVSEPHGAGSLSEQNHLRTLVTICARALRRREAQHTDMAPHACSHLHANPIFPHPSRRHVCQRDILSVSPLDELERVLQLSTTLGRLPTAGPRGDLSRR